ncbi:MAG: ABC transporter permease [Rhodobacteraceae bacterium]|nr:ABC transporter permease [Paracoccaceae bacterium]
MAAYTNRRWVNQLASNYPLWILVGIYALACLFVPKFVSEVNQFNLIRQSSVIGIVSLGMLVVIISAGIDLSVGSIVALAGVIAVGTQAHVPLPLAILAGIGVGVAIGAANGAAIAFLRVSPFVMTLGMLALARGLTYAYTEGGPLQPAEATRDIFVLAGRGEIFGVPTIGLIWLVLVLLIAFMLNRTVFGRRVFAVGSNQSAAFASGVPISWTLFCVYTISGLLCGLAGVLLASRVSVATPTMGQAFELDAIAAVVIGGASLAGGRGTVLGTVIGTLILVLIVNILNLMSVSIFWQDAVRGAIIIAAMIFGNLRGRNS